MDDKKYKIAATGPHELLSGFESLGVDIYDTSTPEDAEEIIKKLIASTEDGTKQYAVHMVVDSLLSKIPHETYQKLTEHPLPALLSIPDLNSPEDAGLEKLKDLTTRAIGSDIFSE